MNWRCWALSLFIVSLCKYASAHGQGESVDHGAHSPHEKRTHEKDHMKDGKHNAAYDHEAVLGSRKEAEKFEQLSPEESKRRLRVLARKMDINGDGYVDVRELTDWIETSLRQLDQEEVDERYAEIDTDNDGKISWEEYKRDAFGEDDELDDEGQPVLDADDRKLLEEDKRYFKAADRDSDGKLVKEEFAAFQNPEGFEFMHDSLIKTTLEEKDKNKDGFIDLKEFLGDTKDKDSEWGTIERDRFENEYDKNKDGKLDRKEMMIWLVPDLRDTAREETEHLFNNADGDKDQKLSYDEIVNHHEIFVGSEATNYGEHLEKMKHDEL